MSRDINLVLDGYNLIHRARGGFGLGEWPVVFNFFRGLRPLVERYRPKHIYFVLEGHPKRNFELLPEYKGNRPPDPPPEFERQKDMIIDILKHMPVHVVWHPDFEADDVIYNIVSDVTTQENHTFVVSSDSDFTQLLQRDLRRNPRAGLTNNVTVHNWREKLDLERPNFDYVRWKALRGDPTDNIPRCPGMTDRAAMDVVKDDTIFSELMTDASFKSTYERNFELIAFQDFTGEESRQMVLESNTLDWDYVKKMFENFDFKSMTKESTWEKYVSTFKSVDVSAFISHVNIPISMRRGDDV